MDAGAVVAWPDRYDESKELSALQHAMNLKLRDEEAFLAEYQNEPVQEVDVEEILTPDQVQARYNGRPRLQVPLACTHLTMFVDVHDKLLFHVVCAWQDDFTGFVVDYGTFPRQGLSQFSLRNARKTLGAMYPGATVEGAVQAGLEALVAESLGREFARADGASMRLERLLVDSGYLPGVVETVKHKVGGSAMVASKGVGITAGRKPMSTYARKPGEVHGHHWYFPSIRKSGEFPHVMIDANYWKSFVHARLAAPAGDRGAMTLFGTPKTDHGLFAQHVAGSETWTPTEGHGRAVREWKPRPLRPDNHWLDCLVGCAVGASILGVKTPEQEAVGGRRSRKKVSIASARGRRTG